MYIPPNEKKVDSRLLNYLDNLGDFILVGDLNAKISKFGQTNPLGRDLEKWLRVSKGMVINEENNHTFHKYKMEQINGDPKKIKIYESTIDLALINDRLLHSVAKVESMEISAALDEDLLWFHTPLLCEFNIQLSV